MPAERDSYQKKPGRGQWRESYEADAGQGVTWNDEQLTKPVAISSRGLKHNYTQLKLISKC